MWFCFLIGAFTCRDYQEQCPPAQEVTTIVNTYLSEKENLDNSLPTSVVIGPFSVRVEGVKQNLSKKYEALATSMLDLLAENLHSKVENVSHLVSYIACQCLVLSLCFWSCCVCDMAKRQLLPSYRNVSVDWEAPPNGRLEGPSNCSEILEVMASGSQWDEVC